MKVDACGFTATPAEKPGWFYLFDGDGSHTDQLIKEETMAPSTIRAFCDGVLWGRKQIWKAQSQAW